MGVKDARNAEKWKNFLKNVKEKAGLNKATIIRLCFKDPNGIRHELKDLQDLHRVQVAQVQKGDVNSGYISLTLHLEVLGHNYQELQSRLEQLKKNTNENGDSSNSKNQFNLADLSPIDVRTIVIRKNFSEPKSQAEFEKMEDKSNAHEKDESVPKAQHDDDWLSTLEKEEKEEKIDEENEKKSEEAPESQSNNTAVENKNINNQIESKMNVNVNDTSKNSFTTVYISNVPEKNDYSNHQTIIWNQH